MLQRADEQPGNSGSVSFRSDDSQDIFDVLGAQRACSTAKSWGRRCLIPAWWRLWRRRLDSSTAAGPRSEHRATTCSAM